MLVSSRKNNCLWIVPGGGVEPNELPDMAAIREVREEAGVNGALGRCLGVFEVCSFQFFLSPTWASRMFFFKPNLNYSWLL